MQKQFERLCKNIRLTKNQRKDARKKYNGVCKVLHDHFYDSEYDGSTKLLFGSYAKKTAIRPFSEGQDVDVLFKISEDVFNQYNAHEGNGQSALLQKVRDVLLESKYALGEKPKAWGKVILVTTAEGTHNVEVLPAFELPDGSFKIPNSEDGGSWEIFDPRSDLDAFSTSNSNTNKLTRDLIRMVKRWALEVSSLTMKSFQIDRYVINFLESYSYEGKPYAQIVYDFFHYLHPIVDEENKSFVETAKTRIFKAIAFEQEEKFEKATDEWKKIFGSSFPNHIAVHKAFSEDMRAPKEEFINERFPVHINDSYELVIDCEVERDGYRKSLLSTIKSLLKHKSLEFFIKRNTVPEPYRVFWKVRNFGVEAEDLDQLRGEIAEDEGKKRKIENTRYEGEHLVECYVVKDGICVQQASVSVPIGKQ